jgi:2-methylcitrate dehydratase PrpD
VLQAKKSILDFLGVALVGSKNESAEIISNYFFEIVGKPENCVLGKNRKTPAIHSA